MLLLTTLLPVHVDEAGGADAVHESASCVVQVKVELSPALTVVGLATKLTASWPGAYEGYDG